MKKLSKKVLTAFLLISTSISIYQSNYYDKNILSNTVSMESECITDEGVYCSSSTPTEKSALKLSAKSSFVMDYDSKTVVHSDNENVRLPIASMCKIMTLLLCFEEIEAGNLSFDEEITVSETASSMGGSQVFLEANARYAVKELIKSIVVCSANDSCVALAEKICGSESVFTDKMNEKAKEIGANNTLFANCTGLPKEPQYSCAKDVAFIMRELLRHKEYYSFAKVWMDKFQHPKDRVTEISNTNKLVRFYDGCDGGKTGFTNQAGYCLSATASRNGMRIISVVIGEPDSKTRFNDVRSTFDYAFANYSLKTAVDSNNVIEQRASVTGGKEKFVSVKPKNDLKIFTKKGESGNFSTEIRFNSVIKAPLKQGDTVGEMIVYRDNVEFDRVALISNENVRKATFFDRFKDVANSWNLG